MFASSRSASTNTGSHPCRGSSWRWPRTSSSAGRRPGRAPHRPPAWPGAVRRCPKTGRGRAPPRRTPRPQPRSASTSGPSGAHHPDLMAATTYCSSSAVTSALERGSVRASVQSDAGATTTMRTLSSSFLIQVSPSRPGRGRREGRPVGRRAEGCGRCGSSGDRWAGLLVLAEQRLVQLLPRPQARETISTPHAPDSEIIRLATSRILTGSPMSSTSTSPAAPMAPACTTSSHASGIVMK